jgi:hypothetical protein
MAVGSPLSEADIWERIIHPGGLVSKAAARRILELEFSDDDRDRMHELAERNRHGQLTDDEEAELDHFCRVGSLLSFLKLRARRVVDTDARDN